MFKAIATDLDGTLLNSDSAVSAYSKEILQKAADRGVEIIVCTGRMFASIAPVRDSLPFVRWAITCMGADVYEFASGKRVDSHPLSGEPVEKITAYALKHNIHLHLYHDNTLYISKSDKYSDWYCSVNGTPAQLIPGDPMEFIQGKGFSKTLYIGPPEEIKVHLAAVQEMLGETANVCQAHETFVECSHPDAQKDKRLLELIARLGIKKEELLVFGDSGNDIGMLKNTGFSVAVANAWPETKQAADILVESNDNDGVARTVRRLVLGEV